MDFLVPPLLTPTSPFVRSLDLWPCERCALLAFADPSRLYLEPRNLLRLWDEAAVRVSSFSCACFSSYLPVFLWQVQTLRTCAFGLAQQILFLTSHVCASENLEGHLLWELGCLS